MHIQRGGDFVWMAGLTLFFWGQIWYFFSSLEEQVKEDEKWGLKRFPEFFFFWKEREKFLRIC